VSFAFTCALFIFASSSDTQAQGMITDPREWVLEVVSPNEKPSYLQFSDAGMDATAGLELQPDNDPADGHDHVGPDTLN
jgi:hypothetical protein